MRITRFKLSLLVILLILTSSLGAEQDALALSKWQEKGLRFEIAPLSADQVRAFFIGRGFSAENAGFIAETGCVFRSAIGNAGASQSDPGVEISLPEWRITRKDTLSAPRIREDWAAIWERRGANEDARTAFHWSLFPTRQVFAPADYNWGMISFALPVATKFDLHVVWRTGKTRHTKKLEDLICG